ncbi:hypothetical protein HZ994_14120 [Akkermansiaceae bacterium]|nr:hypothetical protein HZ994_14120 [Akkermansiaceae bacterium]
MQTKVMGTISRRKRFRWGLWRGGPAAPAFVLIDPLGSGLTLVCDGAVSAAGSCLGSGRSTPG